MANLPTIVLDTTLADLYRRSSLKNSRKRIAQLLCGINAGLPLTNHVPRNTKYLYQDAAFNSVLDDDAPASASAALQRELAVKYLSLIPQRDAFISGDTDVIFFHIDDTPERMVYDRDQADRTMAVLPNAQRPNIIFCSGPADIPVKEAGIDLIAHKIMLDGLEKYDLVVPPEMHWFLNSKAALAHSGLPTPKCDVIELNGYGVRADLCCTLCRDDPTLFPVSTACEGPRGRWIAEQGAMICDTLAKKALPFVLKNQQGFGGAGTYMIHTDEERRQVIDDLQSGILQKLLSSVTELNVHLAPGTLLLSDLVPETIGEYGVTFFVPDCGEPIFLAASEQVTNDSGAWLGSTICYSRQKKLERKFGALVKKTATWLQTQGYVGPAGADVLETAPVPNCHDGVGTDESTRFNIVDLNVRTSGSVCLPLLRRHFTSRGLDWASSSCVSSRRTRNAFIDLFSSEFESGKMCILSWYEDPASGTSLADLAVGAEDEGSLKETMQRLREATEQVNF